MEGKQSINCIVGSCEYNNLKTQKCELENIIVRPCKDCSNGNPADESMCGSYKFNSGYKK